MGVVRFRVRVQVRVRIRKEISEGVLGSCHVSPCVSEIPPSN